MIRRPLAAALLLAALAPLGCRKAADRPASEGPAIGSSSGGRTEVPAVHGVTAEELSTAFTKDAKGAAARFKDKVLHVEGVIERIDLNAQGQEWQRAIVHLRGVGENTIAGVAGGRTVIFYMKDRARAGKLGPGQKVTFEAAYFTTVLEDPALIEATVVKSGPVVRNQAEIDRLEVERPKTAAALVKLGVETTGNVTTLTDKHLTAEGHITPGVLALLEQFPDIALLTLTKTKLSDAGLAAVLKKLHRVERLELDGTKITDASVGPLSGLSGVKELHIEQTALTDAGVAKLRKALPGTRVVWKE